MVVLYILGAIGAVVALAFFLSLMQVITESIVDEVEKENQIQTK